MQSQYAENLDRSLKAENEARKAAEEEKKVAEEEKKVAEEEKKVADEQKRQVSDLRFASEVRLAGQFWRQGDARSTRELLQPYGPSGATRDDRPTFGWSYLWRACRNSDDLTVARDVAAPWSLAFTPDGRGLAFPCRDGTIQLWDIVDRRERVRIRPDAQGMTALAIDRIGPTLVVLDGRGQLLRYDLDSGRPCGMSVLTARELSGPVLSSDGRSMAATGKFTLPSQIPLLGLGMWGVPLVRINPRDGGGDAMLRIVARADIGGDEEDELSPRMPAPRGSPVASAPMRTVRLLDDAGQMATLALSSKGSLLASVMGRTIHLWNVPGNRKLAQLVVDSDPLALAISRDDRILAVAEFNGNVSLWATAGGRPVSTLRGHVGPVRAVALTRDGEVIASAGDDTTVRVWEVESGAARNLLKGHTDAVLGLAFSPDEGLLASAGRDGEVKIWDPRGGRTANRWRLRFERPARHPSRRMDASWR